MDVLAVDDREVVAGLEAVAAKRGRGAPRSDTRIADEATFVLHSYPYKETSLIVDALTRHHGRVALVARGAKRPRSALRGVLLAFQPLSLAWIQARPRAVNGAHGGNDLRTLTRAEWLGGLAPLRGEALMSGFYLNELILKLLPRDDPHEGLFDAYVEALEGLAADVSAAPILRRFETALLREAGYALHASHTVAGEAIEARVTYRYDPERGPLKIARGESRADPRDDAVIFGKTLIDMHHDDYADPATLAEAKRLMRFLLQHHLAGQVLHTRRMLLDLQSLEQGADARAERTLVR